MKILITPEVMIETLNAINETTKKCFPGVCYKEHLKLDGNPEFNHLKFDPDSPYGYLHHENELSRRTFIDSYHAPAVPTKHDIVIFLIHIAALGFPTRS